MPQEVKSRLHYPCSTTNKVGGGAPNQGWRSAKDRSNDGAAHLLVAILRESFILTASARPATPGNFKDMYLSNQINFLHYFIQFLKMHQISMSRKDRKRTKIINACPTEVFI